MAKADGVFFPLTLASTVGGTSTEDLMREEDIRDKDRRKIGERHGERRVGSREKV